MKRTKKKGLISNVGDFASKISEHNLFVLASSISYYTVLGLGPLMLILVAVASLMGTDIQQKAIEQASSLAPQISDVLQLVFNNLNERVNIGSLSGIIGLCTLLFTASVIFMQLRYSLDVIYGDYDPKASTSFWDSIKERIKLMFVVLGMCALFTASLLITPLFNYVLEDYFEGKVMSEVLQIGLNFLIFFVLFTGFYYVTPTRKQKLKQCAKISVLTSLAFLIGKVLLGLYMKNVASQSVYGAAGALFIFLVWAYYSSFILFMSVELFEFLKRKGYVT